LPFQAVGKLNTWAGAQYSDMVPASLVLAPFIPRT
jgi:hypothetical protein